MEMIDLAGVEYCIKNYDEYVKDFEKAALPEFVDKANDKLLEALEKNVEDNGCQFFVYLSSDESKEHHYNYFDFEFAVVDNENIVVYHAA